MWPARRSTIPLPAPPVRYGALPRARCECGRIVPVVIPGGRDGSVDVYRRHDLPGTTERCSWSRSEVLPSAYLSDPQVGEIWRVSGVPPHRGPIRITRVCAADAPVVRCVEDFRGPHVHVENVRGPTRHRTVGMDRFNTGRRDDYELWKRPKNSQGNRAGSDIEPGTGTTGPTS